MKNKWAVGQFHISNLEILKAIVQAAVKLKSPIIIGTSEGESKFLGLKQAVVLVKAFREETGLPIFLNLDHGKDIAYIKKALSAGYDSVHFDGSSLPLKKNIEITKKIIKIAKPKNILVEGEVGIIGGKLTSPEEAKEFVQKTKIDRLAVNIGTVHGGKAKIDFKRLAEIKKAVGLTPLVLHGGSGVNNTDIKKVIDLGVVKINISTELKTAYKDALKSALKKEELAPYKYMGEVIKAVQRIVEEKMKLFGSYAKS